VRSDQRFVANIANASYIEMTQVTISEFPLEFIPLEEDLISLEWDNTFKEIYLVSIWCVSLDFRLDRLNRS
jgi:hypothetical protein